MEYRGNPCLFSRGDSWTCLLFRSPRPQGHVALTETKWQTSEEDAGNRGRVCSVRSTTGPRTPRLSRPSNTWSGNSMISLHTKALRKRQMRQSGTRDIYAVWTEPGEIRPPRCLILCAFHSKLKDFSLTVPVIARGPGRTWHGLFSFSPQPLFNMLFLPTFP